MKKTKFSDPYNHESARYISKSIPYLTDSVDEELQTLRDEFESTLENQCQCTETCDDCHGGNYRLTTELVLNVDRQCKDLIYECSSCLCGGCNNRLVQYGPRDHLQVRDFGAKGKGLVTLKPIPQGGFICEYAGEILTYSEAKRRDQKADMNYILCLNEYPIEGGEPIRTIIDPTKLGNIGRYLNHSCEANCEIISVRVDCPIPRLGIFAARPIEVEEELCFHYGGYVVVESMETAKECLCGVKICTGYMPNKNF